LEVKQLTQKQINNLTNIVYNTDYKVIDVFNAADGSGCFNPRNALIFYDKRGKIFDYMEICFECHDFYSKSGRFEIGTLCNQKYDLLRKFFIAVGVKRGTLILPKMYGE
jgi:hypothetical protein